jgi:DNA-binding beta-propeller fold protein YncE
MRWTVVVTVLAGCAFNNDPGTAPDGGGSGDGSSDPGPCMLSDLTLTAATLSGCSDAGTKDGPRGTAKFSNPVNVALGVSGTAYVLDFDSSLLRKVDAQGNVTTLFKDPRFNRPFGMIMSPATGYLYIECDDDDMAVHSGTSGTIWKIDPSNPSTATIVARNLDRPRGLGLTSSNQLVITDYLNMTMFTLDPTTGATTFLAGTAGATGHQDGNGAGSTFNIPWDLVVTNATTTTYNAGDVIVSEFGSHILRKVTMAGDVTLYAGTPELAGHQDGPLATALFNQPKGMTSDASGAIYVTEWGNHDIRKIQNGMVTTIAGTVDGGYDDNTDPMSALYYGIEGLDISPDGTRMVLADGNDGDGTNYNHVRVLTLP